jgi:hypothetical protein
MALSRTRRLLANGLLALASTAVTLAGVEGAARVARRYQKGGKEQRTRLQYTEYDPLLGWKHQPGARVRYERREYTTDVVINSRGLRDKERSYEAPPGAFRVLALGDSFVEGFTVPFEESVTQVLERAMGRDGCPAEVINGGTVGYSTDQQLLFYREEGYKYRPQVVLLFFYYNDVLYNATATNIQLPKPLLSFKGGQVQVVNFPVPQGVGRARLGRRAPGALAPAGLQRAGPLRAVGADARPDHEPRAARLPPQAARGRPARLEHDTPHPEDARHRGLGARLARGRRVHPLADGGERPRLGADPVTLRHGRGQLRPRRRRRAAA